MRKTLNIGKGAGLYVGNSEAKERTKREITKGTGGKRGYCLRRRRELSSKGGPNKRWRRRKLQRRFKRKGPSKREQRLGRN